MHARRAQRSQIAPKIGHETSNAPPATGGGGGGYAYFGNDNQTSGSPGPRMGYGQGQQQQYDAKPLTPPNVRSRVTLYPPMEDRGAAYYAGPSGAPDQQHNNNNNVPNYNGRGGAPPMMNPAPYQQQQQQQQYGYGAGAGSNNNSPPHPHGRDPPNPLGPGGGALGALAGQGGGLNDGAPKFGRRARTQETGMDQSKQDRLAQYQQELKEQMEAEKERKRIEKLKMKEEDAKLEERIRRENEMRAQRERDDMARERQENEERAAAAMGGRPKKRDPNAGAGGAQAIPSGPAPGANAKFGRRANDNAGDHDKQAKEAAYRAELEAQAREVANRKAQEAEQLRLKDREYELRMQRWAESEAPLGQKQQQQQQQQPPPFLAAGGRPSPPPPLQPQQLHQQQPPNGGGGGFYAAPPPQNGDGGYYGGGGRSSDPLNSVAPQAYQNYNNYNQPPSRPQSGGGYMAAAPYGANAVATTGGGGGMYPIGPDASAMAALRDEILVMLQQQQRQQHDWQYSAPQLPPHVAAPLPIPSHIAQPPPAHRGYAAQSAALPYSPATVRRPLGQDANAQQMLDRFLHEDDLRRDENLLEHHTRPLLTQSPQAPSSQSDTAAVRTSRLDVLDSKFVRASANGKEDLMASNFELDSEPPRYIFASEGGDYAS